MQTALFRIGQRGQTFPDANGFYLKKKVSHEHPKPASPAHSSALDEPNPAHLTNLALSNPSID